MTTTELGGPVQLNPTTELRPAYSRERNAFSLELWRDDQLTATYGDNVYIRHADTVARFANAWLLSVGERPLTEQEEAWLFAGLLKAKDAPDYELFVIEIQQPPLPRRRRPLNQLKALIHKILARIRR